MVSILLPSSEYRAWPVVRLQRLWISFELLAEKRSPVLWRLKQTTSATCLPSTSTIRSTCPLSRSTPRYSLAGMISSLTILMNRILRMLKPIGLTHGHYECRKLDETLPVLTELCAMKVVERGDGEAIL